MRRGAITTKCDYCPLRKLAHFHAFTREELDFIKVFKTGELHVDAGSTIISEKSVNLNLYTVLSGSGFRYKLLEDGRRQILNFLLPGDLAGLQGTLSGEMQHAVEALSPMTLCAFDRSKLNTLYAGHPSLAYDLTWIASREERFLDENLVSVGRRSAVERIAYVLSVLHFRSSQLGLSANGEVKMPLTQSHLADSLGLSLVHTNKSLRRLKRSGAVEWLERGFRVIDAKLLATAGGWRQQADEARRPFL